MLDSCGQEIVFRRNLKDILLGNAQFDLPLHQINDLREQLKGKEMEPENVVLLLRARIAELDWLLDEANCMVHAAEEHIDKLESKGT